MPVLGTYHPILTLFVIRKKLHFILFLYDGSMIKKLLNDTKVDRVSLLQ